MQLTYLALQVIWKIAKKVAPLAAAASTPSDSLRAVSAALLESPCCQGGELRRIATKTARRVVQQAKSKVAEVAAHRACVKQVLPLAVTAAKRAAAMGVDSDWSDKYIVRESKKAARIVSEQMNSDIAMRAALDAAHNTTGFVDAKQASTIAMMDSYLHETCDATILSSTAKWVQDVMLPTVKKQASIISSKAASITLGKMQTNQNGSLAKLLKAGVGDYVNKAEHTKLMSTATSMAKKQILPQLLLITQEAVKRAVYNSHSACLAVNMTLTDYMSSTDIYQSLSVSILHKFEARGEVAAMKIGFGQLVHRAAEAAMKAAVPDAVARASKQAAELHAHDALVWAKDTALAKLCLKNAKNTSVSNDLDQLHNVAFKAAADAAKSPATLVVQEALREVGLSAAAQAMPQGASSGTEILPFLIAKAGKAVNMSIPAAVQRAVNSNFVWKTARRAARSAAVPHAADSFLTQYAAKASSNSASKFSALALKMFAVSLPAMANSAAETSMVLKSNPLFHSCELNHVLQELLGAKDTDMSKAAYQAAHMTAQKMVQGLVGDIVRDQDWQDSLKFSALNAMKKGVVSGAGCGADFLSAAAHDATIKTGREWAQNLIAQPPTTLTAAIRFAAGKAATKIAIHKSTTAAWAAVQAQLALITVPAAKQAANASANAVSNKAVVDPQACTPSALAEIVASLEGIARAAAEKAASGSIRHMIAQACESVAQQAANQAGNRLIDEALVAGGTDLMSRLQVATLTAARNASTQLAQSLAADAAKVASDKAARASVKSVVLRILWGENQQKNLKAAQREAADVSLGTSRSVAENIANKSTAIAVSCQRDEYSEQDVLSIYSGALQSAFTRVEQTAKSSLKFSVTELKFKPLKELASRAYDTARRQGVAVCPAVQQATLKGFATASSSFGKNTIQAGAIQGATSGAAYAANTTAFRIRLLKHVADEAPEAVARAADQELHVLISSTMFRSSISKVVSRVLADVDDSQSTAQRKKLKTCLHELKSLQIKLSDAEQSKENDQIEMALSKERKQAAQCDKMKSSFCTNNEAATNASSPVPVRTEENCSDNKTSDNKTLSTPVDTVLCIKKSQNTLSSQNFDCVYKAVRHRLFEEGSWRTDAQKIVSKAALLASKEAASTIASSAQMVRACNPIMCTACREAALRAAKHAFSQPNVAELKSKIVSAGAKIAELETSRCLLKIVVADSVENAMHSVFSNSSFLLSIRKVICTVDP